MNTATLGARIKTVLVLIILSLVGMGPIPVTSTIGILVVIFRPRWFKDLVDRIYADEARQRGDNDSIT